MASSQVNGEPTHSPGGTTIIRRGISRIILDEDEFGGAIPLQKTWGRVDVMAFTANYIVGTGFLTLPHAIAQSGTVLGSFLMLFTTVMVNMSTGCILEAMARAYPLIQHRNKMASVQQPTVGKNVKGVRYGALEENDNENEDDEQDGSGTSNNSKLTSTSDSSLVVGENRIELPDLIELYLGPQGKTCFTFVTIAYIIVSLWSYGVLVGQVK